MLQERYTEHMIVPMTYISDKINSLLLIFKSPRVSDMRLGLRHARFPVEIITII